MSDGLFDSTLVSIEEVREISKLSRIFVGEQELAQVRQRLIKILSVIEMLSQIDCDSVKPMLHPLDISLTLREDEVVHENVKDALSSIAPLFEYDLYLVPPVIQSS